MRQHTLTTSRLTLRPLDAGDVEAMIAGINNLEVSKWLTVVPYPYTEQDALYFMNTVIPDSDGVHYAIDAGNGLIGVIGIDPTLGYWLRADAHGHGYMTEAATAVVADHFAGPSTELGSGYFLGNIASRNVLWKLGFSETHREAETCRATGEQVTLQKMQLTKERWAQCQTR